MARLRARSRRGCLPFLQGGLAAIPRREAPVPEASPGAGHRLSCRAPGRSVPRLSASRTAGPARAPASSGPSEPSRRTAGASLSPDPASPAVRVPRRSFARRPRAPGTAVGGALAMLFALAALTLAVPSTAQAQNATGAPGITGTAQVGETLTVTQGTIADPDGITPDSWFSNATTTVQWIRVDGGSDSDISSATDRTYTLVAADEGKQVKVKVDFADDDRNDESRTSDAYPADSTVLPADTNAPTVLVSNISAATTTSVRLGTDSSGKDAVQLFTTGTNAGGYTLNSIVLELYLDGDGFTPPAVTLHNVTVTSTAVTLGTAVATLTTSQAVAVSETTYTAPMDTPLGVSTTYGVFVEGGGNGVLWGQGPTGDEDATPAAGWSIGDQVATRAHDATAGFTVGTDGPGLIKVNGTAKSGTAPTGAPTITGTAQVGQTLTAVTTAIMDGDGLTTPGYTYQWIRVATDNTETNIAMATASTYTLVTDDLGTTIKVKVSFTDDASNAETLTSVATAAVATIAVPTNWSLTPTGLATGDTFRLLFLSSTKRDGSSSDIADYHAFIQTRAAAGHADIRTYSTGFRAVGCTADTDARDTTYTTYTSTDKGVPIYWLNGDKAADQYEDFYDGTWDDEVNDKNESGTNGPNTSLEANYPLTGCNDRGTEYFDRFNRSSALAKIEVMVGRPNSSAAASHGPLSSNTALDVSNTVTRPMYGLSAVFQVANNPPTVANPIPDQSATVGTAFSYTFLSDTFSDADPGDIDMLTYAATKADATALPAWLNFAANSRRFSGTPQAADAGVVSVKVTASDGNGGSVSDEFDITVATETTPPTLIRATVPSGGQVVVLRFSENLQTSNLPPSPYSAFTVTADGTVVTVQTVSALGIDLAIGVVLPPIRQGQAVVVTYTDPTASDDTNAIQDTAGNDAASFTTGMNSVAAVTNNSTVATEVPSTWSLKPTAVTAGTQFRLLFLSSTKRNATSTDIADYNTFIQGLAAAGHADIQTYSTGFRAVGCTADTDARDNTYTTYTSTDKGVPIYWLNGAKAADEYEDFYDGSWDEEANDKNESGTNGPDTSQSVNRPFTGCGHNGTEALDGSISQGFGAAGGTKVGRPNSSSALHGPLSSNAVTGTANTRPMYGLSGVFQVAAAVVVPNNPPAFSGTTAARSVAENTAAGQNVGAALTATDADSDTLTYTLEGTDAASFDIVSGSGQIQTRTGVTYNHESKSTYTVVVKADDGNGGTDTIAVTIAVTDVDEPPGQPAAPTVSATAGSTTSLDVTWTAPTNTGPAIASYDVQYRAGTSGNFTDGPQTVTGTSAAIGSLAADTSYEVQVRATNAEGDGDWSVAGTGRTTATSAPGAPTGLSATASGTTAINLSWTAPGSTGGSAITGYKIEVSPNGTSGWTDQVANTNSTATTYAHTGLAAGDTRHYRVSAINANGAGTASNVDSATTGTSVPGAPTSLAATASGTTAINLSWSAPASTGGSAITGYKIEVSANGTSGWTDQVANTNSTATTYAHTGLGGGTTRHYRVSAINANGAGDPSNVANATTDATAPGAPTGLTATASGTTAIDLSWSAPASTGGSAITGYKIESSSDGGSSWSDLVANTGNANTTYAHTGLTAGATRHYRVSAINANGTGDPSNVDSATTGATAPGAPTGLTATASGTTAINLSWSAPASTGGSAITGYKIEVSANGTSGWTDQVANTNSTATTYAHTGLGGGTTRHYRVSAINANGTGTPSNVDSATTDATVPGAPTSLTATASGTTAIDLSWSAPASTGGSAITGYKIEVSANGTSGWTDQVADTNSTATTYAHTALAPGTTRHYRVSAINTNGAGTASGTANATTAVTLPGAPTGLTATAAGSTAINLSWTAPPAPAGTPSPATRSRSRPTALPTGPTRSPTPAAPPPATRTAASQPATSATTACPPSTRSVPAPPPTSTAPPRAPPPPAPRPASRPRPAGPPRSTSPGAPRAAPAAPPSPATRSRSRPTAPPAGPTRSPTPTAPPPPTPTPG